MEFIGSSGPSKGAYGVLIENQAGIGAKKSKETEGSGRGGSDLPTHSR